MVHYRPRRAAKRWLAGAPEFILDCFDNKGKTSDRYTVLFGGSLLEPHLLQHRKVFYLGMSECPGSPQGISMWGECAGTIFRRTFAITSSLVLSKTENIPRESSMQLTTNEGIGQEVLTRLFAVLKSWAGDMDPFRYQMFAGRLIAAEYGRPDAVLWAQSWYNNLTAEDARQDKERKALRELHDTKSLNDSNEY
jgi:hypothetical protein